MSQVHAVFFRRLLPEAAAGVGVREAGAQGGGLPAGEGAGDSLLTPPVPADAWPIPCRILGDADGLFDGAQQP